jgi:transposase-like protein
MSNCKTGDTKERAWRETIAEQQQSGQSARAFCRKKRLNESSFYYWRKQIRLRDRKAGGKKDRLPVFAPVVVVDEPAAAIEIVLGDGCTVRVPPHATHEQLDMVLAALESGRC